MTTIDDEDAQTNDLATEFLDGNGLSLREAIAVANAGDADGVNGLADTILFDAGVFGAGATITLGGTDLEVTETLTIQADVGNTGSRDVTIDANDQSGVISVFGFDVDFTLNGAIVTGGNNSSIEGGGLSLNGDRTMITNSEVSDNESSGFGSFRAGGGIANFGTSLEIIGSDIINNVAGDSGGGILSTGHLTITDSTISGNSAAGKRRRYQCESCVRADIGQRHSFREQHFRQ